MHHGMSGGEGAWLPWAWGFFFLLVGGGRVLRRFLDGGASARHGRHPQARRPPVQAGPPASDPVSERGASAAVQDVVRRLDSPDPAADDLPLVTEVTARHTHPPDGSSAPDSPL